MKLNTTVHPPVTQRFQNLLQSGMQERDSLSVDKIINIITTTPMLICLHASHVYEVCIALLSGLSLSYGT